MHIFTLAAYFNDKVVFSQWSHIPLDVPKAEAVFCNQWRVESASAVYWVNRNQRQFTHVNVTVKPVE